MEGIILKSQTSKIYATQHIPPNNKMVKVSLEVPKKIKEMAENMVLDIERLSTGVISLTARWNDESEDEELMMLAVEEKGNKSPSIKMVELIEKKYKERY